MLKRAQEVINTEAQAIKGLLKHLDGNFEKAVSLMAHCQGRVIITGMGKTGIVVVKLQQLYLPLGLLVYFCIARKQCTEI